MSKIYYREAREEVYYEFWVRADSAEEADEAILNFGDCALNENITDSEGFEVFNPSELDEDELQSWVKNKIIDAKGYL